MAEMETQGNIDIAEDDNVGLPQLEQIETCYYNAIRDAKLGDRPNETEGKQGPPAYSRDDFAQWARKIDIYNLDKEAADFSTEEHRQIVKDFAYYRYKVALKLSKELSYENLPLSGHLIDIGSCIDGSKVGSASDWTVYIYCMGILTLKRVTRVGRTVCIWGVPCVLLGMRSNHADYVNNLPRYTAT